MVVNIHDHHWRDLAAVPGVIAPSLAETVAGDVSSRAYGSGGITDDPPSLCAGDRAVCVVAAGENVVALPVREVDTEGMDRLFV